MYLSGQPGQPTKSYVPWVDFMTALSAFAGTLAALMARGQTGRGREVRGSLLGAALTVANAALIEQAVRAPDRVASLNRSQVSAPSDTHRTRDGWILVQTIGQPLFERWAALVGEPAWIDDPRFRDDMARGDHGEVISARMAQWCAARTTAEALAALEDARIPAGPVLSPQQTLDDPHVAAAGLLKALAFPGAPVPAPVADTPFSLSAGAPGIRTRAPRLGEHTDEILDELGYPRGRDRGASRRPGGIGARGESLVAFDRGGIPRGLRCSEDVPGPPLPVPNGHPRRVLPSAAPARWGRPTTRGVPR